MRIHALMTVEVIWCFCLFGIIVGGEVIVVGIKKTEVLYHFMTEQPIYPLISNPINGAYF